MRLINLILRSGVPNKVKISPGFYASQRLYGSKSDSDSDQENSARKINSKKRNPEDKEKKNSEALNKLNFLLKQMVEDDVKTKLDLAKPKNRRAMKSESPDESVKSESVETKIVTAVKNVAETIGGDVKQTESELLSKLLTPAKPDIAESLSDIVKGMKIDREVKTPETNSRAHQVRQVMRTKTDTYVKPRVQRKTERIEHKQIESMEPIDIFGSKPFGIFNLPLDSYQVVENETWNYLKNRELRLAITHPPANYFQEMIQWTDQGKIWKFPIDNEQDLGEEHDVYFTEHVFMEQHLESWCPEKGPIRHFMELVCVGLSKNPFLSVKEKKEHIDWYKNYFEDKKKLLRDLGAIPATESKQIVAE